MIIVKNKHIPSKGYSAIMLFPFLFCKRELSEVKLNHENIHARQFKYMTFIGLIFMWLLVGLSWWLFVSYLTFYIFYIAEYILKLIWFRNHKKAYMSISFEKEAFNNQNNLDYL
jgi:hypothetical protein